MKITNGWILTCVTVRPHVSLHVFCPGQRQDQQQEAQQVFAGDFNHDADENSCWHSLTNQLHILWWIRDCTVLWSIPESRYSSAVNLHFRSFMFLSAVRRRLCRNTGAMTDRRQPKRPRGEVDRRQESERQLPWQQTTNQTQRMKLLSTNIITPGASPVV